MSIKRNIICVAAGAALAAIVLGQPKPESELTVSVREGTNIAATVSPGRDTIVMDLQGALWTLPVSGGVAKRLTDPTLEPARPDYSPKGGLVAFEAYKTGTFHIWTMRPDGTGLRQLTDGHGDDREPRFSPDGARIAFSSDRAFRGSYDIWVLELASGKLTQWTNGTDDEYEPAWSPDGSEIAYVSGAGTNGTAIAASSAEGGRRIVITAAAGAHLNSPSWSPDGKRLAYTEFRNGKSHLMIQGEQAARDDDVFPFPVSWLSANRILYTANGRIRVMERNRGAPAEVPFEAQFQLRRPAYRHKVMDLDSAAARPVKGIVGPALSPDGKRIVFEALNQIWLMEIGGKPQALTNDSYYKEDPAWSPDGKRIAYSSDRGGTEDLYILDLATRRERRLTATGGVAETSAAWSPDGSMLAYQDQDGATFVIDVDSGKTRQAAGPLFAPSKPSWASNAKTLGIGALKPYTRRFREGTSQILTADVSTGALTYTEPAPFQSLSSRGEDGPIYSPDGTSMAFVMNGVLWIRPVDGNGVPAGAARQVNHESTDAPTWSGDSKRLLYLSNGVLRLIDRDGSNPQTVAADLTWQYHHARQRTIIHAGRLWDGRGAGVTTDMDIVIANDRIQAIEPHRERGGEDASTRLLDASTLTAIPGLWESHTHEWIGGKAYGDRLGRLWLAYGVTSLQSQGDPAYRAVETRESFGSGARVGPRYFASGEALDGERVYYNFMRPITSEQQFGLELGRVKALDYDLLKTYVRLPHAMQQEAVRFAHEQLGIPLTSHYMLPGIAYGMDGMSHVSATARLGFAYTRSAGGISYADMRKLFAVSGMFDISTPFASFPLYAEDPKMVDDERLLRLNTPWEQEGLRAKRDIAQGRKPAVVPQEMRRLGADPAVTLESLRKEEETVAAILHSGGAILAGTDSPLDNVASALHLNLRAQVKFGVKPWEALQTATILPARAYGVADQLGTIETGKLADIVLVSGDPLSRIADAANVVWVIRNGQVYSIGDLVAPFAPRPQKGATGEY
jgi:Tol biopolymer transport system component